MDDAILVTGRAATRSAVLDALDRLAERSVAQPYDLAVVHVSSHGSSDGTLLLFDAIAGSEAETGLAYAEFIERVGRITANHVVVVFDVCYSGLCAGRPLALRPASVIDEEGGTSAVASDGDPLLQLFQRSAVGNRAIVWAAGPHERAWELPRLGHGLLTYGLLAGLDGTSLAEGGRVSVTRWIEAAIVRAEQEARDAGHLQRPGRAMQWQGTTWMPARPLGPRRAAQLARRDVHAITPDPASLTVYGLSASACAAVARHIRGGTLNEMQVRAVERAGVMAGKNVLVAAPTSSGKTLIGELAALAAAARRQKTVMLLPTRALTNEKWAEFRSAFGEALGLRTVRSFGGVEDDDLALARNHFDVAFLTYEKFLAMCLARPSLLDVVGTVVLDEVHHMGDVTRGRTVEMLLLLLRRLQQDNKRAARVQIVALSAVLGAMNGFPTWLDAELVQEATRPVPLREGVVTTAGVFRYLDETTGAERTERLFPAIPPRLSGERDDETRLRVAVEATRALATLNPQERVLAFRAFKPQTRRLAAALAALDIFPPCLAATAALAPDVLARDDSRATAALLRDLAHGVAFHVSDLEQREREVLEAAFRSGELHAMVATSGLAMGINTPASTVLVVDTEHYTGVAVPYSVGEYRNMAGRAGRWLADATPRGTAILIAGDPAEAERLFATYVRGTPEPLVSQLSGCARTDLALGLVAILTARGPVAEREVTQLANATFDGYVNRSDAAWRQRIASDLRLALVALEEAGFVTRDVTAGTVNLTESGRVCGREGLAFASARRVLDAADAVAAAGEPIDELALVTMAQVTDELEGVYAYANVSETKQWERALDKLFQQRPALRQTLSSTDPTQHVSRLKRTYAVFRWAQGVAVSQIEEEFGQWFRKDEPAAGVVRQIATRTGDVVRALARLIAVRHPDKEAALRQFAAAVRPRLEFGVGREGAELTRYRLGLSRGELRALATEKVTTFDALAAGLRMGSEALRRVFGDSRMGEIAARVSAKAGRAARERAEHDAAQLDFYDRITAVEEL